jgi:tetratricopeptide (TPR) repeat protein
VPVRQLQPAVPRDLETVGLKCLEKDPAKRYPSAEALADDLGRFLDGRPVLARPVGPAGRAWRWARRRPALAGLSAVLAVLLPAALAGMTGLYLHADAQRRRAEERERESLSWRKQSVDRMAQLAGSLSGQFRDAEALELFRACADEFSRLAAAGVAPADCRRRRAEALMYTSLSLHRLARTEEALRASDEALAAYADCAAEAPGSGVVRRGIRYARHNQAAVLRQAGRHAEAVAILDDLIAEYAAERGASDAAKHSWRTTVANLYHDRGMARYSLGRYAESVADYEEALRHGDGTWWSALVLLRAKSLARCGRAAEAVRVVRDPLANPHLGPALLYEAACALALASAADLPAADGETAATQAVQLLRQALTANPSLRTFLATDAQLSSLSGRPDFQALVRDP